MKLRQMLLSAVFPAIMVTAGAASATVVSVSGTSGPWDPTISDPYGSGDQSAPTVVAVNVGDDITISYLSGFTSSFAGVPPTVDANGYVGDIFGSGADCGGSACTGIGSSGKYLPSYYIDPTNTGPQIALNELIGDFVNSSGAVLEVFAIGDGPLSIIAPADAVALQMGVNDDIFNTDFGTVPQDNSGALLVDVTGSTAAPALVPEPASLVLFGSALLGLGAIRRRRRA